LYGHKSSECRNPRGPRGNGPMNPTQTQYNPWQPPSRVDNPVGRIADSLEQLCNLGTRHAPQTRNSPRYILAPVNDDNPTSQQ
jgi:hypothetical protein